jgi:predicted nucleic acid-binding protein
VIVTDASVVLELLLRTPAANALEARLFGVAETLHAPHLLDVEVALAEALGATLVTRDQRLAAAPGTRAAIELV